MRTYTDEHGETWRKGRAASVRIGGAWLPCVVLDVDPNMALVFVRPYGADLGRWVNPDPPSNELRAAEVAA